MNKTNPNKEKIDDVHETTIRIEGKLNEVCNNIQRHEHRLNKIERETAHNTYKIAIGIGLSIAIATLIPILIQLLNGGV